MKQLQREYILKAGALGTIGIGGNAHLITAALFGLGQVTLTIEPIKKELSNINPTEDAEFEIIQQKQLT